MMSDELFNAIIDGRLEATQRKRIAQHLSDDCRACDHFFKKQGREKRWTLVALLQNRETENFHVDEEKVKREILTKVLANQNADTAWESILKRFFLNLRGPIYAGSAAFATLVMFIIILPQMREEKSSNTLKGPSVSPIILTARYGLVVEGSPKIEGMVTPDMELSRETDLLFSFQIATPGYIYITQEIEQNPILIYPESLESAVRYLPGSHDLTIADRWVGYSLRDIPKSDKNISVRFCAYLQFEMIKSLAKLDDQAVSCIRILLKG